MSCGYCKPKMTIRDVVFYERIPVSNGIDYGGTFAIIAKNGAYFLRYENTADVFYNDVSIDETRPINNCPMCGRKL